MLIFGKYKLFRVKKNSIYIIVTFLMVFLSKNRSLQYSDYHMAKVLALDYGQKRTGVAVTDDMQIIASGLKTVETKLLFEFLTKYFADEDVESVVLGEPKQMNFEASESEVHIQKFVKLFEKKYPKMPLIRVDERFTSKMAFQTMIDSGLSKKKRQNKALVDEISATIILQSYLYNKR